MRYVWVKDRGPDFVRVMRVNGRWCYECPDHGPSVRRYRTSKDAADAGRRHLAEDARRASRTSR